jgi:hypothetical protein
MTIDDLSITETFGIELEFFVIDKKGNIVNKADSIINPLKRLLEKSMITNEAGQHMLEIMSKPNRCSLQTFKSLLEDTETLLYETENNDLKLFNFGTYPSINKGKTRLETRYQTIKKIRGTKLNIANTCIGFHYHFSLPRGTFDPNTLFFKDNINDIRKNKVQNLFNLYVALDPAVSTFMQSSPYYENEHLGKSSRTLIYRSEEMLGQKVKLFPDNPELSSLNKYAPDFDTIKQRIVDRAEMWRQKILEKGVKLEDYKKPDRKDSILDSSWKPVKISSHGTIESRGADMNNFKNIVGMTSVMNVLSKFVQRNKIEIKPSDIGINEPFKLEDNVLHVPEYEHLSKILQKNSALIGLEDKAVFNYSNSMLKLVKKITSIEVRPVLRMFSKMLDEKQTVADEFINKVKKIQGRNDYLKIQPETAKEIVLNYSEQMYKDLLMTKKMAEKNLTYF